MTDTMAVLFFSCAGNAEAPFWPGYVPPTGVAADPMTYAASTTQTSFSQNAGEIVWTFGDI